MALHTCAMSSGRKGRRPICPIPGSTCKTRRELTNLTHPQMPHTAVSLPAAGGRATMVAAAVSQRVKLIKFPECTHLCREQRQQRLAHAGFGIRDARRQSLQQRPHCSGGLGDSEVELLPATQRRRRGRGANGAAAAAAEVEEADEGSAGPACPTAGWGNPGRQSRFPTWSGWRLNRSARPVRLPVRTRSL